MPSAVLTVVVHAVGEALIPMLAGRLRIDARVRMRVAVAGGLWVQALLEMLADRLGIFGEEGPGKSGGVEAFRKERRSAEQLAPGIMPRLGERCAHRDNAGDHKA